MNYLVIAILRSLQMLCGIVVLSLSVELVKGQIVGSAPATTGYDAFVGGFLMLDCIIGMTALGVSFLAGPVSWVIDALVALTTLAGGIATAVQLHDVNCGDAEGMLVNNLVNGGLPKYTGSPDTALHYINQLPTRCKMDKADTAFMFFGFATTVACIIVGFMHYKRGSGVGSRTYV